ncbi:MAG TPA: phage portal protein, partial [Phycisphaerales bacterium]|nr:phage portal protein [Phycisphaerales bacterium]
DPAATDALAHALAPVTASPGALSARALADLLARHQARRPALAALWDYYRNPLTPKAPSRSGRPYALAQQRGLPLRLSNPAAVGCNVDDRAGPREVVIENDIAWRIGAMIDFLVGKPIRIVSAAADPRLARTIERVLESVIEGSGGLAMLQEAALLGHVYGSVDLLVHTTGDEEDAGALAAFTDPLEAAEAVRVTPVDPGRAAPLVSAADWRRLDAFCIVADRSAADDGSPGQTLVEVYTPALRQVLLITRDGAGGAFTARTVSQSPNRVSPGAVPVAHIQNVAQPFVYAGLGEVEPLIPLQDELNTRLSDRANRVTMQSFKMYLAKGVDGFERTPVGPGVLLSTDNPDASITSFGGDAASPSEDRHIDEVREALDKISGVPPLATGVVRARVGNLSSENALRLTLQGLIARTARKRITYGRGITHACSLILSALHHAGLLRTTRRDRQVRIEWPDPVTADQAELLRTAEAKRELGVTPSRLLNELGYATQDAGVE